MADEPVETAQAPEHVDVLIVGAGLSGIGAACHLTRELPGRSYAILEARDTSGGTWDLFRYPGVRSDSDMFTLGYDFKPWTDAKSIADGDAIRDYIRETAREYRVDERIRYRHRVVAAAWSSEDARWTVDVVRTDGSDAAATGGGAAGRLRMTCSFLWVCAGYYRYDEGYTPEFAGIADYAGRVVHPQHWPDDLDYEGKRVLVIGSGATAVTLVPAMAEKAAHVTMLQRSPSYILSLPSVDPIGTMVRRRLSAERAYAVVRWKNVLLGGFLYRLSRRRPAVVKSMLRKGAIKQLPEGYDVDTHFSPAYDPWDQRLCLVPDGDLFRAVRHGRASLVTDRIDRFTEKGVRLQSGEELEADVVVTATGLNLQPIGGLALTVDGAPADLPGRLTYKGMMLDGIPNFVFVVGYTNASWTLKADLVSGYVCRLLKHMADNGYAKAMPVAPAAMPTLPLIDLQSGYVLRSLDQMPRQGAEAPWRLYQNYPKDLRLMRRGELEDGALQLVR
jgi:cation diffusion facilitator CzcD-associated flavoprotein CzcO